MPHMPRVHAMRVACVVLLVLMLPLSGCLGSDGATVQSNGDAVDEVASACTAPAVSSTEIMTVFLVDGVERQYRLTVPARCRCRVADHHRLPRRWWSRGRLPSAERV